MLSSMAPEELAEAKSEAEARLPAAAVEFLRRRGLEKQKKATAENGASSSIAAAAGAPPGARPSLGALELNSTGAPCFPPPLLGKEKATKKKEKKKRDEAATPAAEDNKPPPPSASSRLRFDFDSACPVLPLAGENEKPSDALSRDPLRSERRELGEENAYTLSEAAALARSAVPAQRLAAVDLMVRVISKVVTLLPPKGGESERVFFFPAAAAADAAAAAAADDDDSNTSSPPPPPTPLHLSITWSQVRLSLMRTVPLALLSALSDGHPAVVAAAATGLALLVDEGGGGGGGGGRDGEEEEDETNASFAAALAASSIFPLTGSPALASAPATRPHAVGAWVRQGVVDEADDGDDDDQDQGDGGRGGGATSAAVAADPVSGLLLRPALPGLLLERAAAVLAARSRSHQAYRAATLPLTKVLRAAAAAGGAAAAAVVASRSAVAALVDVACAGEETGGGEEEEANSSSSGSSSSWSSVRARAAAFDAISLLCAAAAGDAGSGGGTGGNISASSSAAAALAAAGVGGVVSSTLLVSAAAVFSASSSPSSSSAAAAARGGASPRNFLLLTSSLRAWRALMERGVPCIRLDDAFSTLRFLFVDDDDGEEGEKKDGAGAGAAGGGGEAASSSSSFLFFAASAEALAAAAAAIASKEAACCSRGGASAVAAQVLSWATSKEALLLAGAAAAGEAGVEGSSSAASAAAAAAFLTRLAAAWRLLAVAEGETLLEGGKLRAAVAEAAAGGGEPGAKRDLEVLVEGAGRAAAKLFESGPLSSSERAVSVACCELLAALAGLYRSSSAPSPPWMSPRALTSARSPLGRGAVAAAAAAAAAAGGSSSPASADASAAIDAALASWTRADAALHQARRHAMQLMAVVGFGEGEEGEGEEGEESGSSSSSLFSSSVPLAVLQLAPPGTEATIALPALAALLSPGSLAPLLARADGAVEELAAGTSPLAASAGRFGCWERLTTRGGEESKGVSATAAAAAPAVKAFSTSSLADYSATWLGMMAEEEEEGEGTEREGEGEKTRRAAAPSCPPLRPLPFRLADPAGSRLPLPPWGSPFSSSTSWVLADVCPRGVASAGEASEAVGRALTLALALLLEEGLSSPLSPSTSRPPPPPPLPPPPPPPPSSSLWAASVADLLLGGDSGVVRGDSEAWRNPRARWAVAALSEEVSRRSEREGGGSGESPAAADAAATAAALAAAAPAAKITPARATGWASTWASDTFGDALCGGLVAAAALVSSGSGGSSSSSSAPAAAAVAAFDVLEESDALSSLPAWEAAVFVPPPSTSVSSSSSFKLPVQLASRAATALAAGRLDRAIEESGGEGGQGSEGSEEAPSSSPSPSPSLALSDAVAWLREQCLAVLAKESGIGYDPSPADPAAAAAALRHFMAQARPRHVAALLLARSPRGGEGRNNDGLAPLALLRALRSASGGNEALDSKVREAEKMMPL